MILFQSLFWTFLRWRISLFGEGIKGCVTERCAGWVEIILLSFGEEVSIGFERLLLILGGYARASHTPAPLKRGGLGACFLLVMSGLWREGFPS